MKVYGLKHKNEKTIMNSSSGGAFSAISDIIISNGGIVYGASYNKESNRVEHIRCTTKEERDKLRGSKYVQSYLGDIFIKVYNDIIKCESRPILFSGTLCQVMGLKKYLKEKKCSLENLFFCDILCHGVASPLILTSVIDEKKKANGIKTCDLNFRFKTKDYKGTRAILKNGLDLISIDDYMRLYYGHCITRSCCHICPYTKINRESDFSIGDFWGIEKSHPKFKNERGVSIVLVNSLKGEVLWNKIIESNEVEYIESQIENTYQPNLYNPTKKSIIREKFWNDYEKKGIKYILDLYAGESINKKVEVNMLKIVALTKKIVRKMMP